MPTKRKNLVGLFVSVPQNGKSHNSFPVVDNKPVRRLPHAEPPRLLLQDTVFTPNTTNLSSRYPYRISPLHSIVNTWVNLPRCSYHTARLRVLSRFFLRLPVTRRGRQMRCPAWRSVRSFESFLAKRLMRILRHDARGARHGVVTLKRVDAKRARVLF